MTTQTLYEKDFNLWIEQTINYLKDGDLTNLDRENLIEEIQSVGNSDKRETFSRLKALLMYLLKWKYQPEKRTSSRLGREFNHYSDNTKLLTSEAQGSEW